MEAALNGKNDSSAAGHGSSEPSDEAARAAQIQLVDGTMFAPLAPNGVGITLETLSCGLANVCRFGGQVWPFYSVAQHSVLVALLCDDDHEAQKYALLHDGEEAFGLPDLVTPVKPFVPVLVKAQARIGEAIYARFNVDGTLKKRVKQYDTLALALEKRDLKRIAPGYLSDLPAPPAWLKVRPLSPQSSYRLFRAAYRTIFIERQPITPTWIATRPGFTLL